MLVRRGCEVAGMEEVAARTDCAGMTTWVASYRADGRGTAESGGRLVCWRSLLARCQRWAQSQ
jgi:hypothetical protein